MKDDIFKNSSNNNVKTEKTKKNKEQIEDNAKKSVQDTSSVEKTLKPDEANEINEVRNKSYIHFRNTSEKIRYEDEIKNSEETFDNVTYATPVVPVVYENYSNDRNNGSSDSSAIENRLVNKTSSANKILKESNNSKIVKEYSQENIVNGGNSKIVNDQQNNIFNDNNVSNQIKNTQMDNRIKSYNAKRRNSSVNGEISEYQQSSYRENTSYEKDYYQNQYSETSVKTEIYQNQYSETSVNTETYQNQEEFQDTSHIEEFSAIQENITTPVTHYETNQTNNLSDETLRYSASVKYNNGSENSSLKQNTLSVNSNKISLKETHTSSILKNDNDFSKYDVSSKKDKRFEEISKKARLEKAKELNSNSAKESVTGSVQSTKEDFTPYDSSIKSEITDYSKSVKDEYANISSSIKADDENIPKYANTIKDETPFYDDSIKADIPKFANTVNSVRNNEVIKETKKDIPKFAKVLKDEYQYNESIINDYYTKSESINNDYNTQSESIKNNYSIQSESIKNKANYNVNLVKKDTQIHIKDKKISLDKNSTNIRDIAKDRATNYVVDSAKNSDNDGVKALGVSAEIGKTLYDSSKVVKGKRRNLKYDKNDISKKSLMLGIKDETVNNLKKSVLTENYRAETIVTASGTGIKNILRGGISQLGEEDSGFKGIDITLQTVENAKFIKNSFVGTEKSLVNGTKAVSKATVATAKGIANTPKNVKKGVSLIKTKVRKLQKFMRLSKTKKLKYVANYAKSSAKNVASAVFGTIANGAKSMTVHILGGMIASFLLVIICVSFVLISIIPFMWLLNNDMDTTGLMIHLSGLDYERQDAWYQGNSVLKIEEDNNNEKSKKPHITEYYYELAVDVPPENTEDGKVHIDDIHCSIAVGGNTGTNGTTDDIEAHGFNKVFHSREEMLEAYRWTTDDYRAAFAYLQIMNGKLDWFSNLFGGLTVKATKLHKMTYDHAMVLIDRPNSSKDKLNPDAYKYSFTKGTKGIYKATYSHNSDTENLTKHYYFGRKYSVRYLIENNILRFDDDDEKNEKEKQRFENIYKFGNIGIANLAFPLKLKDGETIDDRIVKHFGKQLTLEYVPPTLEKGKDVYGEIKSHTSFHYANDLSAEDNEEVFAPIGGLCKVTARENRGYEYTICTSYNGDNFDFTKNGYLVKISCLGSYYLPEGYPQIVKKGNSIGRVAHNPVVNFHRPNKENDTENEDIFADFLFPCCTQTQFRTIGANEKEIPESEGDYIHIEMYKLPCDFTNVDSIKANVLPPELFFDYQDKE